MTMEIFECPVCGYRLPVLKGTEKTPTQVGCSHGPNDARKPVMMEVVSK